MRITFHGAAGLVTGSKHLIESNHRKILLDCGLFQGPKSEVGTHNNQLPFDAREIDAVVLSHAHADHCGMLPVLVKNGFHGQIFATPATIELARFIMEDSAKIQEQDANYINDHLGPGEDPIAPIYTFEDVEATLPLFEAVPYARETHDWTPINKHLSLKFYDAGHILGSAMPVLSATEHGKVHTLAFTGDLGPSTMPLLPKPETFKERIDTLLLECTYGATKHASLEEAENKLVECITWSTQHNGKIIIPAFSLGRTQEIVYILHKLTDDKKIPRIPIYIDSPLATKLTGIFTKYSNYYDRETWKDFGRPGDVPLHFRNLLYTQSIEESKSLNVKHGPFIVISASGMLEGGRVLHHLKHSIQDENNTILLTGYQAPGTLGRKLMEGAGTLTIHGSHLRVRARIEMLKELSAHADQHGLLSFARSVKGLKELFLVHSEQPQAENFKKLLAQELPRTAVHIPRMEETFELR